VMSAKGASTTAEKAAGEPVYRRAGKRELQPRQWDRRRRVTDRVLAWTPPVLLIVLWQVTASAGIIDRRFYGSPADVVSKAADLFQDGAFFADIRVTVTRLVIGYVVGSAAGIVAGLLMGQFRTLRVMFEPIFSAFYVVPKLAMLPILLLVFGSTELPLMVLVSLAVFFVMMISSLNAAVKTPPDFIDVSRSFEPSRWTLFRTVVLPASLPSVFSGLRIASGTALLMLIGGEFVASNSGLGYTIWHAWSLFDAPRMYVGVVTVALLGVVFTGLIALAERLIIPWATTGGFQS
jgi:ABC-type nitrate/sulfonate/bicarbonate transport system permease component